MMSTDEELIDELEFFRPSADEKVQAIRDRAAARLRELTAGLRHSEDRCTAACAAADKWVIEYDAALSRAEAAEKERDKAVNRIQPCPVCCGNGNFADGSCWECRGTGRIGLRGLSEENERLRARAESLEAEVGRLREALGAIKTSAGQLGTLWAEDSAALTREGV